LLCNDTCCATTAAASVGNSVGNSWENFPRVARTLPRGPLEEGKKEEREEGKKEEREEGKKEERQNWQKEERQNAQRHACMYPPPHMTPDMHVRRDRTHRDTLESSTLNSKPNPRPMSWFTVLFSLLAFSFVSNMDPDPCHPCPKTCKPYRYQRTW